jgi:quercetin 2,3-dioxygenase
MLEGTVDHEDSMGHTDSISAGDVEWMTAGSGVIHQEMPKPVNSRMGGFQLWVNLPRAHKMMAPRYRGVKHFEIPVVQLRKSVSIRIIAGRVNDVSGPVQEIIADPEYLDISLGPDTFFTHPVQSGYTAFAYVIGGGGTFDAEEGHRVANRDLVLFGDGSSIWARSFGSGMRFLFLSGRPIKEPVAWRGPIVMNTREELRLAFKEYADGTFIKKKA